MTNGDESLDGEGDAVDGGEQLGEVAEKGDDDAELSGGVAKEIGEATTKENEVEQQVTQS